MDNYKSNFIFYKFVTKVIIITIVILSPLLLIFIKSNFNQAIFFDLFNTNDIIWQENIWIRYYEYIRILNNNIFTWVGIQHQLSLDIIYVDRFIPRGINFIFSYFFGFFYGTLLQFILGFTLLALIDNKKYFLIRWSLIFLMHIISIKYIFFESYSTVPVIIRSPENLFAFIYFLYFFSKEFKNNLNNYILLGLSIFFSIHLFIILFFIFIINTIGNKNLLNNKLLYTLPFLSLYLIILIINKNNIVFNIFLQFYTGKINASYFSIKSESFYFIFYLILYYIFKKEYNKKYLIFVVPFLLSLFSLLLGINIQILHFRLYFLDYIVILFLLESNILLKNIKFLYPIMFFYLIYMNYINYNKYIKRTNNSYLPFLLDEIHQKNYKFPTFWNGNSYNIQSNNYKIFLEKYNKNFSDSITAGSLMIHYYEK